MVRMITQSYGEAINSAIIEAMGKNDKIHILGQGADDPTSAYGPLQSLKERFPSQIHDVPMSEEAVAGICIGMAMNGLKPVNWNIRMDFMLLAMNQICNMAAKISYMYGGRVKAPVVFRGMIGKSWGQGPQHSQGLYPLFCHFPGLKVLAPVIPYDAQGVYYNVLMNGQVPTVIVEHRLLYYQKGEVLNNEEMANYKEIPQARVLRHGKDVTLVGISMMAVECMRAATILKEMGIDAEVITPIILNPLDIEDVKRSVCKTGNLIVVDNSWIRGGIGADIVARLHEKGFGFNSRLMGFAETVCPTSPTIEKLFYPTPENIANATSILLKGASAIPAGYFKYDVEVEEIEFKGPF
jgi:pyruvate/2-oxoglutarate/acetoin dehydrogenase E1 component